MKDLKRYFSYIGKYKKSYFLILGITIIFFSAMDLFYSYLNKLIFNAIEYQDIEKFYLACILCIIFLIAAYFQYYLRYFEIKQVRLIVFDIKISLFEKLNRSKLNYIENSHSGNIMKLLNFDANNLKEGYFSGVYRVAILLCDGVISIVAMLLYSYQLAIISIIFSLITVTISITINNKIKIINKDVKKKSTKLMEYLSDILSGFLIIKMYSGASIVKNKFFEENEELKKGLYHQSHILSNLEMLTFLSSMIGNLGTIISGAFMVSNGKLDYGTVMAVVTLQMNVSSMFQNLGSAIAKLTTYIVTANRIYDFAELDCEENFENKENVTPDLSKGIVFKNISFSYDNNINILEKVNLSISTNEKIIITGKSGCGKSTLLKLLMRFYEPDCGEIKLFGNNIKDYSLYNLRNIITYIPQNNYLFEGTILENILLGNPSASQAEAINAAKAAYADKFIDKFPLKYDTPVSDGGKNLSGGQCQRIAIARAFLKNSPVLLMDEPSSALDIESEKNINLALNELMKNKIVIMVTHRTTSFEKFDKIINLKNIHTS